jgi:hypothetical protein
VSLIILSEKNIPEITDVLCEAFYTYPVVKYVLGEKEDYDNRLRNAVTFSLAITDDLVTFLSNIFTLRISKSKEKL